jgi:1-acyl-sn-glycerol-3-phosphate acyltransferase
LGGPLLFYVVQMPLAVLATAVLTATASLAGLVRPGAVQALSRVWSRLLLRLFRVEVRTEGQQQLPAGPAVFAANHSSSLDILVVLAHLPVDVRIIYKKSLSYVPLLGWSIAVGGHIPIDRSNPFRARRSLQRAAQRIRGGTSVLVFPEGTRSPDGSVGHFKRGSFSLAIDAGVPVVPVSLAGVKKLVPRGLASLRPGRITLRVHPLIFVATRSKDDAEALAEETRRVVAAGCEREA